MGTLDNTQNIKSEFNWDAINVGDYNLDHSEKFFEAGSSKMGNATYIASPKIADCDNKMIGGKVDTINVGDYNLDHSENFFEAGSSKMGNTASYIASPKIADCDNNIIGGNKMDHADYICAATSSNKENLHAPLNWNTAPDQNNKGDGTKHRQSFRKQGVNQTMESILQLQLSPATVSSCDSSSYVEQNQFICKEEIENKENKDYDNQLQLHLDANSEQLVSCKMEPEDYESDEGCELTGFRPKLRLNWTPGPTRANVDAGEAVVVGAPRAYEWKDMYRAKREMAMRQRDEEERKAREFHSNPVPNFKAMHKRLAESIVIHRITVPVTPETVKHSKKWAERQAKLAEMKQPDNSKSARKVQSESKPFQLRADQRVRERREYDNIVQCNALQKKKQQDEERRQHELEELKELRKRTEFKARPNPFK